MSARVSEHHRGDGGVRRYADDLNNVTNINQTGSNGQVTVDQSGNGNVIGVGLGF